MSKQSDKCPLVAKWYQDNVGEAPSVIYDRIKNNYLCTFNSGLHCELSYEQVNKMLSQEATLVTSSEREDVRGYNVGESDYSKHKIQPWDIWIEYKLNPFDADIVKRVLRHKKTDSRKMDYEKIIHICKERIRQIETGDDPWEE